MAKPFRLLVEKMSEESRQRMEIQKRILLAEIEQQETIAAEKAQQNASTTVSFDSDMFNMLVSGMKSWNQTCQQVSSIMRSHDFKINTSLYLN